ncbi:hypothetical protein CEH80_14705 [Salmonella enterica subsp. enterica serovar Poona]|nr:hypothetical protein [Salmonella enterica subsp. enterica serovar Poona]
MNKNLTPSPELLARVRIGFVVNGTSLHKWCQENGVKYANARQALIGAWNGPMGKKLRNELITKAGLE